MTTTLIQLRRAVQDASGRPIGGSDATINKLVNDAYLTVARDMRVNFGSAVLSLTPGQADYSMRDDLGLGISSIKYITYAATGINNPLEPVSFDEILRFRSVADSGTASYYYSFIPPDFLSFYPAPTAAGEAELFGDFEPLALVDDTDAVDNQFISDAYTDLIVLKALVPAVRTLNKGKNAQGLQMGEQFQTDYMNRLSDFRRDRNRSGGSRNRTVQYGSPRRPRLSNDTYVSPWGRN